MVTFNIIYTPGTARCLQLFVFSLLKRLDCSFRLVVNGCPRREKRLLRELCRRNRRLELLALPAGAMVPHGEALSYLQRRESSDTFCFMDSDILAAGNFLSELAPRLGQNAGVSSGAPVCGTKEERILTADCPRVHGRFSHTDTGLCLGSTYLAMYDNRVLDRVIRSTGIGFERRRWTDVPAPYRRRLAEMGLEKAAYDTGKLLNLLLLAEGAQLAYVELPSVVHIGGISIRAGGGRSGQPPARLAIRGMLPWFGRAVRPPAGSPDGKARSARPVAIGTAEPVPTTPWQRKRRLAGSYFVELLRAIVDHRQLPPVPEFGDPEIEEQVRSVRARIVALYEEFRGQLVA